MENLDRYTLDRLLRAEPGGDWWLGHHTTLGSQHLLRVCPADRPDARAELAHSAKIQAKILHPNLLRTTDTVDAGGRFAAVYDKVPVGTLAERLQSGPLAAHEILPVFRALLAGVEALHSQTYLHLDLNPARIFWCDGNPKIADCRFARREADSGSPPRGGNPAYTAPELAQGQVDVRSDIYALGCIAYELHTGVPLFRGSPSAIAEARRVSPDLSSLPPSWINLLDRCLRADPAARYPYVQNLIRALEEVKSPRAVPVMVQEEADLLVPPVVAPVARNRTPAAPVRPTSGGEPPVLPPPGQVSPPTPVAPSPMPPATFNPPSPHYRVRVEEEDERSGIRWVPILGIAAVLVIGLVTCTGIVGALWYNELRSERKLAAVPTDAPIPPPPLPPDPDDPPPLLPPELPPEPRPKKKTGSSTDGTNSSAGASAPATGPAPASASTPPPPEAPAEATATGNLKIEFWGELLPNAVEATCRGGYRSRSPVVGGVARFEGMPMGIDCLIFPKGAATTAASVRAGRDYKCELRGSTTRCQ